MKLELDIPDALYAQLLEANYDADLSTEEIELSLKKTILINGLNGAKGHAQNHFKVQLHAKIAAEDFAACATENDKLKSVGECLNEGIVTFTGQAALESTIADQLAAK